MQTQTRKKPKKILRTLALIALVPAGLLALRLTWGIVADIRFRHLKSDLNARDIELDNSADVSDPASDPVEALRVIGARLALSAADQKLVEEGNGKNSGFPKVAWDREQMPPLQALVERHQPILDAVDSATKMQGAVQSKPFATYKDIRGLANMLYAAAVVEHENQADGKLARCLEQILNIGRALDGDHTLIGHLVGLSIESIGYSGIEYLAPSLQLDSPDARAQVSHMIQLLQERKWSDSSATLALRGEYAFVQQMIQESGRNAWWIRPLGVDECRRTMHTFSSYIDAWADDWPECNRRLNSAMASAIIYSRQLSSLEYAAFGTSNDVLDPRRYFLQQFRADADAAANQLLLASRLYFFKHGVYPQAARDLVPEFLAAVPIDPFSAERAPMRYRLDTGGPTVWSVGENGTDEGAPVKMDPHEPGQRIKRYAQPDVVYGAAWANAPSGPDPVASSPAP